MKYVEIMLMIRLKQNIKFYDLPEKISQGMNNFFRYNDKISNFHKSSGFKLYNFSLLRPIEKNKIYLKDKAYTLTLRFANLEILNDFYKALTSTENSIFSVIDRRFEMKTMEEPIGYLTSITPAVISVPNIKPLQYLDRRSYKDEIALKALNLNALKKYNTCFNQNIDNHDFIESIEVLNHNPCIHAYKGKVIIGNKFKLKVKKDELSQKIAFAVLGFGLAEKNSLAYGFCNPTYKEG